MTSGCTRAQSFLPKLQLSVWLSLDLSLVPYYDAEWRPLVCFGPMNRRSKNIRSRSFRPAMSETSEFALAFIMIIESPVKLATASPFFMFSQHWAFFTFSFTQSQVKLPVDRLVADGAPQFQERRCSVDLHRLKPASTPMSIRLPCCGRQKQVKLAMDVVERKEAMQEKSENDARKDWVATWKNLKAWTN